MNNESILSINELKVYFPLKSGLLQKTKDCIKAVDNVSLQVQEGETLGLVGESGCGKTTLGRSIVRLNEPLSGSILFKNNNILSLKGEKLRKLRRNIQMVFQDPYSSLNPRQTISRLIGEVLIIQMGMSKEEASESIAELLRQVGLSPSYAQRYPHEFSGGQRQRIAIAKALALKPEIVICDEAVSALDVSVQSQIINLLIDLREQYSNMTYIFISHDLNIVEHISDRVAVMYLGKIVELAKTEDLYGGCAHPYTQALLSSMFLLPGIRKKERIYLKGEVPSASSIPTGCRFHTRCPYAFERCRLEEPPLIEVGKEHYVACHLELSK